MTINTKTISSALLALTLFSVSLFGGFTQKALAYTSQGWYYSNTYTFCVNGSTSCYHVFSQIREDINGYAYVTVSDYPSSGPYYTGNCWLRVALYDADTATTLSGPFKKQVSCSASRNYEISAGPFSTRLAHTFAGQGWMLTDFDGTPTIDSYMLYQ